MVVAGLIGSVDPNYSDPMNTAAISGLSFLLFLSAKARADSETSNEVFETLDTLEWARWLLWAVCVAARHNRTKPPLVLD